MNCSGREFQRARLFRAASSSRKRTLPTVKVRPIPQFIPGFSYPNEYQDKDFQSTTRPTGDRKYFWTSLFLSGEPPGGGLITYQGSFGSDFSQKGVTVSLEIEEKPRDLITPLYLWGQVVLGDGTD